MNLIHLLLLWKVLCISINLMLIYSGDYMSQYSGMIIYHYGLYINFIFIYAFVIYLQLSRLSRSYTWQGGAGTWSDGKLATRIGRNSDSVLAVRTMPLSFSICVFLFPSCH